MDLSLPSGIAGEVAARALRNEEDTTNTKESESLDEIAPANGERSDEEALVGAIQLQAYELYLSRGETHGDDLADWLEAERIVRRLMP